MNRQLLKNRVQRLESLRAEQFREPAERARKAECIAGAIDAIRIVMGDEPLGVGGASKLAADLQSHMLRIAEELDRS